MISRLGALARGAAWAFIGALSLAPLAGAKSLASEPARDESASASATERVGEGARPSATMSGGVERRQAKRRQAKRSQAKRGKSKGSQAKPRQSKRRKARRSAAASRAARRRSAKRRAARRKAKRAARRASSSGRRIRVRVIDVAGGRAYLSAGSERRVAVGDRVVIDGKRFQVVAVNRTGAAVELGSQRVPLRARGVVRVGGQPQQSGVKLLEQPLPLSNFVGAQFVVTLPADAQSPKFVPLGGPRQDDRKSRALLSLDHALTAPLDDTPLIGRTRLRARLHYELESMPLTLDFDGFSESWYSSDLELRRNNASRPLLFVRQLKLGYRGEAFQAALGRLRYAAANLGQLDGARATSRLGDGWSLSVFGGTLAAPLDGALSDEASRFGAELSWAGQSLARPAVSLTAHASRFNGKADERRLLGSFSAYPGQGRIAASAEVSLFGRDNPWGADRVELTWLGADASLPVTDRLRLDATVDIRRPDRSLRLQRYLPTAHFCVGAPVLPSGGDACVGSNLRYRTSFAAWLQQPDWTLSLGTEVSGTRGARAEQAGAFGQLRFLELLGRTRLDLGASASTGTFITRGAATIGLGRSWLNPWLDASVYYRPAWLRYEPSGGVAIEHGLGGRVYYGLSEQLDLQLSADALSGSDAQVLFFYSGVSYRPRF